MVSCRHDPGALVKRGNDLYAQAKFNDAIVTFRKALQQSPQLGDAYYGLGLAYTQTGEPAQAYEALSQAVSLMPNDLKAKAALADLVMDAYLISRTYPQKLYTVLNTLGDDMLQKDAASFDGLRVKGFLALTDNRVSDAVQFLERANQRKPMVSGVVLLLVQALIKADRSSEAEKLAHQLIEKTPSFGAIYDVLEEYYRRTRRIREAEQVLQLKVKNNPDNPDVYLQLARFYRNDNRSNDA